ncbi:MAG: hypothetical protein SPL13_04285 [Clostridia bacterium]|nr:hypothetical protein [Clostridia bacterium]
MPKRKQKNNTDKPKSKQTKNSSRNSTNKNQVFTFSGHNILERTVGRKKVYDVYQNGNLIDTADSLYGAEHIADARYSHQKKEENNAKNQTPVSEKNKFPDKFPFWGRLKIEKNRPTLVIDEDIVIDKKSQKEVEGFVHREVLHKQVKGQKGIMPNPDKTDPNPMYLQKPRKLPKRLIKPLDIEFDMPKELKEMYEKNNNKNK